MALRNEDGELALEATLQAVLTELQQKLESGQEVALDAATLAALENITVTVSNQLTDVASETTLAALLAAAATETTLAAVLTELGQKLEPGQEVALDAATLAALENITVTVSNQLTDVATETTLAALLAELQTQQKDALTDTELRATPVPTSIAAGDAPEITDLQQLLFDSLTFSRDGGGNLLVASRQNQWETRFFEQDPNNVLDVSGTGTASNAHNGHAHFTTGATAGQSIEAVMREAPIYVSGYISFYLFTASLSAATGTGKLQIGQRTIGATEGHWLERDSTGVYFVHQRLGDPPVRKPFAEWNGKHLTRYTRDGVVEAVDFSNTQVLMITQLWLGSGPVTLWAVNPDANDAGAAFIPLHTHKHPNLGTEPSTTTANIPLSCYAENGDTAEALTIRSGCWAVGNTSPRQIPVVSDSNSTRTAAAVFNGKYVSTLHAPFQQVSVDSDQSGTLTVTYSHDSTDDVGETIPVPDILYDTADGVLDVVIDRRAGFFKLDYVADVAPTRLSITTEFLKEAPGAPSGVLKEPIGRTARVVQTKSALFHKTGNQTTQTSDVNPLPTTSTLPNLQARMLAAQPATGYIIAFDVEDTNHFYIMEAPEGTATGASGWRGIRIPKSAAGAPFGAIEINTAASLTFDGRVAHGGWS